ncbi:MAG: hypoxanthine phosphoribosyltransferase [Nitrospirae bacterium]|nr:MAG: hypoxanthine phosphoribosyltransferase [Nitrospirota bacterium]
MVIGRPLLGEQEIQKKVKELAESISEDFSEKEIVAIGILKGAFMFYADLIRQIRVPVTVDFILASSYLKTETTGEVKIHADIREDIKGRDVLLVEDIVDTGITLNHLRERLLQRAPSTLKICALLDKKERRMVDVPIDYVGFEIPDEYVVGYGLDFDGKYRNMPYIAVFKRNE